MRFFSLLFGAIVGLVVFVLFNTMCIFMVNGDPIFIVLGWVLLGLEVVYLINSFGTIKGEEGELAALYILGKPIMNLGPGPYFRPALISSIRREKSTITQSELPSDPENIYRGDDLPPAGKFPPIRVKFGPPNPLDVNLKGNPYNIECVEEVVPVVGWRLNNIVDFALTVGDNQNCLKMLSDIVVEICGKILADKTPAKASLMLNEINKQISDGVQAQTKGWGIEVTQAYMKPFIFSHDLNKSVEDVSRAELAAKAVVAAAKGNKEKEVLEAEGKAKAVELAANAEKLRLVQTGLAKVDADGNIIELIPDATTKANATAIAALSKVTGTVVLGPQTTPVINVSK